MVWKYRFSFADYQWIPNRKVRDLRQKYCTFHTTPVFQSEEKSLPLPSVLSNVVLPKIKNTNVIGIFYLISKNFNFILL